MNNIEMKEWSKDFCNKDYDEQLVKLREIASRQGKEPIVCMAETGEFMRDILIKWRLEEIEELKKIQFHQI